jgi:hypothetical protein
MNAICIQKPQTHEEDSENFLECQLGKQEEKDTKVSRSEAGLV